jgi:glutamate-1-semialdehyde 2,1-aminomutase
LSERYRKSEELLARAERSIPLGTQTFSKSKTQYPFGVSPYFISRGAGSHVWDVDGNEYVDFVNSLAAVTLGHGDPDVNAAVAAQLQDGTIFSLAHPLEMEVAERIIEMAPCAEMARFGKNGSDATAGAIRLARGFTRRDRVAVCGYHGWQDWYIGSTARWLGVPQAVRDLTHTFLYNDLSSLDALFRAHRDEFAAVILEPMNVAEPAPGFLEDLKAMTHRHGALLVFDETITGFRFANGGAQELFGVTPDLATYGKGLANGYPLSAVAGRTDVMRLMEEIFFSFTMGGETLSLAAAKATLDKLKREPVLKNIAARGQAVIEGVAAIIAENRLGDFVSVAGRPCWSFVLIKDTADYTSYEIKTLFLQEMLARGVLTLGSHNMSYAHTEADVAKLLAAYREAMPIIGEAVRHRALKQLLKCEPLQPLFKVR